MVARGVVEGSTVVVLGLVTSWVVVDTVVVVGVVEVADTLQASGDTFGPQIPVDGSK